MLKDAMYRTAAVEMFHRGAVLVRKETLDYNPNDHAHAESTGWCSHCKTYHVESFGADPFQHPTECPKLANPITGIFIDGDAGGNSLFGGHDNMVGKRISQEFLNLQHRYTLAMIIDEAMTHISKASGIYRVFIKPRKPLGAYL